MVLGVICIGFLIYDLIDGGWGPGGDQAASTEGASGADISIQEPGTGEAADSAYYENYQLQREQVRSKELALLDEVVNNSNSTEESRNEAGKRKIAISENMEQELIIENLLAAKNFKNSAAFIQEGKVTVVLDGQLDDNEATQVADIVDGVTGVGFGNVVIVKRE